MTMAAQGRRPEHISPDVWQRTGRLSVRQLVGPLTAFGPCMAQAGFAADAAAVMYCFTTVAGVPAHTSRYFHDFACLMVFISFLRHARVPRQPHAGL